MPHLTLEYSENIIEQARLNELLRQCHDLLAEALPTDLASCKSRAIGYQVYTVGDGQADTAFIHLSLKVMAGRTENTLQEVGEKIMGLLSRHFSESLQKLKLQMTLEISEVQPTYFKIVSN